ncbi:DUF5034 domain-containing protein [Pseudoalteromonas maricaloris]|uniref:DUF5034 domain-containing protein n=1 Tax=Pseudoalteromonas maricaloris TaxID=184924 RepID=UPI0021AD68DB|nr:DUF5034 domain-containing protein [Pseudoalteromonas flavipulchra]
MKAKLVFASAVLAVGLVGCNSDSSGPDDGQCGGVGNSRFDITGFNLGEFSADQVDEWVNTEYDGVEPISYQTLVFQLKADTQSVAQLSAPSFEFSLISTAYACSPVPPYTDEKITDINITSSAAFSDEFPAGSSLNEVFDIVYIGSDYSNQVDYRRLDNGENDYFSISEFLDMEDKKASEFIQFALNSEPTYKQNHVFYIEISLDTGEQFSLESQELSFTE